MSTTIVRKRARPLRSTKAKAWLGGSAKLLLGVMIILPIVYAVALSFMPFREIAAFRLLPTSFYTEHYQKVAAAFPVFRYLFNTLFVCLIVLSSQIVIACLTAYALVFFEFRGRGLLFTLITMTMMIPGDTTVIANYLTVCDIGLVNTYLGVSLPYLASGMGIFLMRQFFMTVPRELKEAAEIDGCSKMRFLMQILVPLAVPSIAGLAIYSFVGCYNHFLWPLLVTNSKNMRTIQIGMSYFTGEEASDFGALMAGAVVTLIVPVICFAVGHQYLVKGMTSGAVKG